VERAINGSEEVGRWRRYIAVVDNCWAECFEEAEERAMENVHLRTENQQLRAGANSRIDDDIERATREPLAARAQAEEAQQEIAQLRMQLAEAHDAARTAEQAVRTMMSVSPRNLKHDMGTGTRNVTFTINRNDYKYLRQSQICRLWEISSTISDASSKPAVTILDGLQPTIPEPQA
jgi:hypothetical protein